MWWDVRPLNYTFTAESVLKEFLKLLKIWQSYGGKVVCLKHRVHWGIAVLKDEELTSDLTYSGQKLSLQNHVTTNTPH